MLHKKFNLRKWNISLRNQEFTSPENTNRQCFVKGFLEVIHIQDQEARIIVKIITKLKIKKCLS